MKHFEPGTAFGAASSEEMAEYLYDMIEQMAQIARQADQAWVALHLEAIVIAQRAIDGTRSERSLSR